MNDFIEHLNVPKLTDEERDRVEGPLALQECKLALDTFQANKTPGEDGFTVEFNKYFVGLLLGEDLVVSFNAAYDANELSIFQRRGVITLIPKQDASLLELSNWRPITLLNVVHSDQTGFIKGRYIGQNIRLIIDIMEHTKSQNKPDILVLLDFQKAFDSLEWPFMMNTLDIFNFGTSY